MKSNDLEIKKKAAALALADYFNLAFPDRLPEPTDSSLHEHACHLAYCAQENVLRPARILAALKKLPLGKLAGEIRAALNGLDEAFNERNLKERELSKLNAMLANLYDGASVDPRAAELESQISILRGWLAVSAELNRASDKLYQELCKASRQICPLQNLQSLFHRGWIAIGIWATSLSYTCKASVESRAKSLAKIANDALVELEHLQSGELPVLRNPSKYTVILDVQMDEK
jgi:hypothetical protein